MKSNEIIKAMQDGAKLKCIRMNSESWFVLLPNGMTVKVRSTSGRLIAKNGRVKVVEQSNTSTVYGFEI